MTGRKFLIHVPSAASGGIFFILIKEAYMRSIIYLIGLAVVIFIVLRLLGLT